MNEEYSREAVFEELGQTVPEPEMQRAETYRSGWYRVLLVADLVRQLAFSDFTIALCQLSKYEPEGGIKENAIQN